MSTLRPFHLAIPVENLESCRSFYRDVLGFEEGRSDVKWVDFNFYGHQFVLHQLDGFVPKSETAGNAVDGHTVPIPHFGIVLSMHDWKALRDRLKSTDLEFIIEPYIRFEGQVGEQATMFFKDPEGNALEFKGFDDLSGLFEK